MRLIKFLLGVLVGATAVVLVTPKTGRQMREQLLSGASSRMLPAAPEYPEPAAGREWAGPATAVAEAPAVDEEIAGAVVAEAEAVVAEAEAAAVEAVAEAPVGFGEPVQEPAIEELVVEEVAEKAPVAEEAVAEEAVAEETEVAEEAAAEPVAEEVAAAPVVEEGEDLRARIEQTRAEVESVIAEPFAAEREEVEGEAPAEAPVAGAGEPPAVTRETAVAEAAPVEEVVEEEVAAEEPVAGTAVAGVGEEEGVAEAAVAEVPVEEAPEVPEAPSAAQETTAVVADVEAEAAVEEAVPAGEAVAAETAAAAEVSASGEAPEIVSRPQQPERAEVTTIDQAEMRRRIEETRARLKAKAFDAMMSGKSALLSRDSGENPVPRGADVDIDEETKSTLEASLSPEDD